MHSDRKIFTLVLGLLWLTLIIGWLVNSEREIERLESDNARLQTLAAKLEAEACPPHMVNMYTGADGKKWVHDPWRPWIKDSLWDEYLVGLTQQTGRAGDR